MGVCPSSLKNTSRSAGLDAFRTSLTTSPMAGRSAPTIRSTLASSSAPAAFRNRKAPRPKVPAIKTSSCGSYRRSETTAFGRLRPNSDQTNGPRLTTGSNSRYIPPTPPTRTLFRFGSAGFPPVAACAPAFTYTTVWKFSLRPVREPVIGVQF